MNRSNSRERAPRGRILLIDDDQRSLDTIRELLTGAGYDVIPLSSPIGATQMIATHSIDAVVVDMTSPALRGPRFSSLLASWDRVRDLPMVLISDLSVEARDAIAPLRRVSVAYKDQLAQSLLRKLDRALALRQSASQSQSGVLAIRPGVRHYARAALEAWRDFVTARSVTMAAVVARLVSLRSEAAAIGLEQTTELVSIAIELVERCDNPRPVPHQLDERICELLEWLSALEVDKGLAFDRSLAVNLHRAHLEQLRSLVG